MRVGLAGHIHESVFANGGHHNPTQTNITEGGSRTGGISQYSGLAIHSSVLKRLQNFLPYSSFQRVTNQLI
jgi:hypothetical protein